jgi:hypothetical protein
MADQIVSWGGIDSKGTDGMGITGSLSVDGSTFISSSNATQLQVGNNLLFVSSSGDIGVGTTSPAYKLQVNGTARFGTGSPYLKVNPSSVEVEGAYLFAAYQAGVSFYAYESVFRGLIKSDGSGGNALKLGDTAERMRITGSNVGIGTTTPTSRLQVQGSGTTSSTTSFLVQNANASSSLTVRDDTAVIIGGSTTSNSLNFATSTQNAGQHAINYTFYTSNNFPVRLVATATAANGTGYLEVWATSSDGGTATSANSVFRFGNGGINNLNNISYLPLTIGGTTVSGSSSGQIMSVRTDQASADLSTLTLQAGNATYLNRAGGNLILSTGGSAGSGDGVNGYIAFKVTNVTASAGVTNSTSEVARFSLGKNLLIGTTTDPGYKLNVSGSGNFTNNLTVTGSATISNILTLSPQDPLPTGVPTGSFAVSSSAPPKPYFYDGTTWNALY